MPGNLRREPKQQERKPGASLARARGSAGPRQSAARPSSVVRLDDLKQFKPGHHVIHLFGAAGAILPLIVFALEKQLTPYLDPVGPFGGVRVLLWPASILTAGIQRSYFALTCLYSVLLNIAFYFVIGCLVWLGLQRPRSIVYLTTVGMMYLTVVGVNGLCEWLLP